MKKEVIQKRAETKHSRKIQKFLSHQSILVEVGRLNSLLLLVITSF
jgi:hypothetical protein